MIQGGRKTYFLSVSYLSEDIILKIIPLSKLLKKILCLFQKCKQVLLKLILIWRKKYQWIVISSLLFLFLRRILYLYPAKIKNSALVSAL